MKVIHLLLSFLMVFAFQWESHLFVNAKVPQNVYFPQDKGGYSLVTVGDSLHRAYLYESSNKSYYLQSCRYNPKNKAFYCEFSSNGIYRVKFISIYQTSRCNFDEKYLVNKNQFLRVSTRTWKLGRINSNPVGTYNINIIPFIIQTKEGITYFYINKYTITRV
ncbi:hypothetical protein PIROE2DRAFT_14529 [Piromyces sp. E2]|nr:hypothetical protein PIROE2DRAFT_14529 [Piromyces sp. E2]|eukprot:OUM59827.1 hypothetical protein PIROE2DRAFT_14529 [Piromyces sp. E2]